MLKFAVYDNDGLARSWTIGHGHLIGQEQLVLPGDVTFDRGYIIAEKKTDGGAGSAGIGLLFPTEPVDGLGGGLVVLRTCLLPQRAEPYLLSLELARQKVMQLFTKLEEWALFDLGPDEPVMKMVDQAREAFTAAVLAARRSGSAAGFGGVPPYSRDADKAGRNALNIAVAAGELLALYQARLQHTRRCTGEMAELAKVNIPGSALTDDEAHEARGAKVGTPGAILPEIPLVGVRVNPNAFAPPLCEAIQKHFDFVSIPMRWVDMEPVEGKYAFAKFDRWIEWAVTKAKLPVHAGAVVDLHPRAVPDWLSIWEHDYETLRDVVCDHVKNVVTRYRRTVNVWTVASSLNVGGTFKLTYEQAIDLTRSCVQIVKKLQPTAKVQVEVAQPFGEHAGQPRGNRSIPAALYCELMNQTQTMADSYAVSLQMGQAEAGRASRAAMSIAAMLDRLAASGKPLTVSMLGCPSRTATPDEGSSDPALAAGTWRAGASGGLTPEIQAEFAAVIGAIVAGKTYVQSLCWQELIDAPMNAGAEMPGGGLMTQAGQPKPALAALAALRAALRERKPLPATSRLG